jgi:hypothetical protein
MRQRIDVALAPHATALLIDGAFRDRWRIRHVWTLGTSPDGSGSSLGNRSMRIGDFDLHADTLPIGAWRAEPSSEIAPWYLAATFGDCRVTVASDADAVDRMPLDPQRANAVICRDGDLELPVRRAPIQMMALPADLDLDRASTGSDTIVVPLHRDTPIAIRMHRSGVGLESTV